MEFICTTKIELVEFKNTIPEMKNTLDGINRRLFSTEEKTSDFADMETNYSK